MAPSRVFRLLGLALAVVICAVLLLRSPRIGVTRALGISMIVVVLLSPVVWPWYLPAGFALVAASGMGKWRPTYVVLIIAASSVVFPTTIAPVTSLNPYQHLLSIAVVVLIVIACFVAQNLAAWMAANRARDLPSAALVASRLTRPASRTPKVRGHVQPPVGASESPWLSRPFTRFVARLRAAVDSDAAGLRQAFAALLVSSGGDLLAGLTLGAITGTLEDLPGLLVLVPAAIGMRGNIFGALGSRLGTSIHTGTFRLVVAARHRRRPERARGGRPHAVRSRGARGAGQDGRQRRSGCPTRSRWPTSS